MIAERVARLRQSFGIPADPARRGPVPLNRFYEEMTHPRVSHFTFPELTLGAITRHLRSEGIDPGDLGDPAQRVDGMLLVRGRVAWAYVSADGDNPLVRQRFTAAHELGHAVLHHEQITDQWIDTSVAEAADVTDPKEREANRFAAELLMPTAVIAARVAELKADYGACPRGVLEYRLAAELLVSREAIRYRLRNLEVGDD